MIFDTHCHYNLPPLLDNWQSYWQAAQSVNVSAAVVVGTDLESSQAGIKICQTTPNLYPSVAIHPGVYTEWLTAHTASSSQLDSLITDHLYQLESLLTLHPNIVAIGETGLDYYRLADHPHADLIRQTQTQAFRGHLELAVRHRKPIIIHARDQGKQAYWDILTVLTEYPSFDLPLILHCVSGPLDYIQQALNRDAYLGIAGNITYKNADHLRSILRLAPQERLLLETDAPYLPPHPHRGQLCQPAMISLTEQFLREEMRINTDQLASNATQLFGIS